MTLLCAMTTTMQCREVRGRERVAYREDIAKKSLIAHHHQPCVRRQGQTVATGGSLNASHPTSTNLLRSPHLRGDRFSVATYTMFSNCSESYYPPIHHSKHANTSIQLVYARTHRIIVSQCQRDLHPPTGWKSRGRTRRPSA